MKILKKLLLGFIGIITLLVVSGYVYLKSSVPESSNKIELTGPKGKITIKLDQFAVPHVSATSDQDAFFALGYLHARDRMWQIEMQRRIAAGRMSELLGESLLSTDQFMRTLGGYEAARETWNALDEKTRQDLESYRDGVNQWISEGHTLPLEFKILNLDPEPWTVVDSLSWTKMMAFNMSGNYGTELNRLLIAKEMGAKRGDELLPPFPKPKEISKVLNGFEGNMLKMANLMEKLKKEYHFGGEPVGSNAWVVSGKWTESGQPLLANDPHLGSQIPSLWYMAELKGDKLNARGATLPGLPYIIAGHNQHISWGITSMESDVQDLMIERINPANSDQYEADGKWKNMEIRKETIHVRNEILGTGTYPVEWKVRSTRHGAMLSDVMGKTEKPFSLQWNGTLPKDTTLQGFQQLNYAKNWKEFRSALKLQKAPGLYYVYADVEGNIGAQGSGWIPIRKNGEGEFPVSGWDSKHEWTGWIPFEAMPYEFNPESGMIVAANQRMVSEHYPHVITHDWAVPYRANRIKQLLNEKKRDTKLSIQAMVDIQQDQVSLQAQELLPFLLKTEVTGKQEKEALAYLTNWNGLMARDSIAASIYQAWQIQLVQGILDDETNNDALKSYLFGVQHPKFLFKTLNNDKSDWCDIRNTDPVENCETIAASALTKALADLTERMGPKMADWKWGELHHTQFPHTPFSEIPGFRSIFHRTISNGGDQNTVNVAAPFYNPGEIRYQQYWLPGFRSVVDMSDLSQSLFMLTPGQSGNPLSPHYDDLMESHRDLKFFKFLD